MTAAAATAIRNGSWAQGGTAAFRTDFSSPGGVAATIVGFALEYVAPLNEWLDDLVGDEGQVRAFADDWRRAANIIDAVEQDLHAADNRLDVLEGRTARAMRKRFDELRSRLELTSESTSAIAEALELASQIVTMVHDAVVGALSELAGLVGDLFGFELSLHSLDPFDRVEKLQKLMDRAWYFIEMCGALIQRMFDAFTQLIALIQALWPLLLEALKVLREIAAEAAPYIGASLGATLGAVGGFGLGGIPGGIAGGLGGGAAGWALGGGASTLLQNDARVTEVHPDDLTMEQYDYYLKAQEVDRLGSLADLVQQNTYTDGMGGSEQSVVDVKKIRVGDEYRWVVSLPSTQDWNIPTDAGATNDLNSNVALMTMDNELLRTQYERAVYQAMQDAGVPDGAEVVWTGFSQGGIMAANLAENSPYSTVGVVTNGSPTGTFDLDPDIPVYSFQHATDPVPHLDTVIGANGSSPHPNHHTITLPNPTSNPVDVMKIHKNDNYAQSVAAWETQMQDDPSYQEFLGLVSGEVVDHQQHRWNE